MVRHVSQEGGPRFNTAAQGHSRKTTDHSHGHSKGSRWDDNRRNTNDSAETPTPTRTTASTIAVSVTKPATAVKAVRVGETPDPAANCERRRRELRTALTHPRQR